MRIEWEIGIYPEYFERALKWYNLAFKDKHPSKDDERIFHIFEWLIADNRIQDTEEEAERARGD